MTEQLTKADIKRMVSEFIRAYNTEIEKNTLPLANQWADDYLTSLSQDMNDEDTKYFVDLAAPELLKILKKDLDIPTEEEEE